LYAEKARSPVTVLGVGAFVMILLRWSQPVLLIMALAYFLSGIVIRVGGIIRRYRRPSPPRPRPEHQIG
jgi:hypothetical protein